MNDCITKLENYNGTPLQIDIGFQCATKEQYAKSVSSILLINIFYS